MTGTSTQLGLTLEVCVSPKDPDFTELGVIQLLSPVRRSNVLPLFHQGAGWCKAAHSPGSTPPPQAQTKPGYQGPENGSHSRGLEQLGTELKARYARGKETLM